MPHDDGMVLVLLLDLPGAGHRALVSEATAALLVAMNRARRLDVPAAQPMRQSRRSRRLPAGASAVVVA